ncbi:piggyBac transposable element-derived protein 4 [Trichonephila clavipes]|nr:piggyBac transposable element-derived protein 4 [Trichonephila clavipes]
MSKKGVNTHDVCRSIRKNSWFSNMDLREVKEVRQGKISKAFERWPDETRKYQNNECFIIIYGNRGFTLKSVSCVAKKDECEFWVKGIRQLAAESIDSPYPLLVERWLRKEFYSMENLRGVITIKDLKAFLPKINLKLPTNRLKEFFQSSESENDISSARMWVEEKTVCPATPRFDFTESPGILVNFSDDTLIQYFEYFFDDSMLELIVEETNVYAEQCFHSHKSKMHSKQREWRATCRLSWKQYLPLKRARFGIKMYMLCEAKSGYVWSSIIFTGRGTLFDEEFLKPEFSKSMQVVLTLMKPLLNKGYCVTLDNYYSSPILTDTLVKYKTDSYGTINLNRKEVPSYVKSKKLKKGETVAFRRGKALILKWKDKKDVSLISTIHNSEMIAVRSSREEKLKPKIVVDYNDTMGGVDRADQNLASYAIPRKYGKKYY